MPHQNTFKNILIVFCIGLFCFSTTMYVISSSTPVSSAWSTDPFANIEGKWDEIESKYFHIYFRPKTDLKKVEKLLKKRRYYVVGLKEPGWGSSIEDKIAYRMDKLFVRARELLDMKPRMKRIHMIIMKNRNEVEEQYTNITRQKKRVKSFYHHKSLTIYTSLQDMTDSVIAHEIGHSIVDHYFVMKPPAKVAEMLASYVDMHLEEERILVE